MRILLLSIAIVLAAAPAARAAVPGTLPFAGRLADAGGPVNGNVSITFTLFDASSAGTQLWTESQPSVAAQAGLVTTQIGAVTPLDPSLFDGTTRYLEVIVNGTTMSPRLALASVPYALHAATADSVPLTSGSGISVAGDTISTDNAVVARKDTAAGDQSFDNNTLLLDYTNHKVAIGGTSANGFTFHVTGESLFNGDLHVSNQVVAQSFAYTTLQTRTETFPGDAFKGDGNWQTTFGDGYGYLSAGTTRELVAAVHELKNVFTTVTGLVCEAADEDPNNNLTMSIVLTARMPGQITTSIVTQMTNVGSAGLPLGLHLYSAGTLNAQVTANAIYEIAVDWTETPANGGPNLRFYGCELTYTSAINE